MQEQLTEWTEEEQLALDKIDKVREFHEAIGKVPAKALAFTLVSEEAKEVREAWLAFVKELADLEYTMIGYAIAGGSQEDLDGLGSDLKPILDCLSMNLGPKMSEVFNRVHASNMTKFDQGVAIFRADGKLLKSEHYVEPKLDDLF